MQDSNEIVESILIGTVSPSASGPESTFLPMASSENAAPESVLVEAAPSLSYGPESALIESPEAMQQNLDSFYAPAPLTNSVGAVSNTVAGNGPVSSVRSSKLVPGAETPNSGPVSDYVADEDANMNI